MYKNKLLVKFLTTVIEWCCISVALTITLQTDKTPGTNLVKLKIIFI